MAPETDTDDRVLAYVAGELSKDARRAFEAEMARDPALLADVEGMLALQSMLDEDMQMGLRSGDDEPPVHLTDAIMRAEALMRPAEIRAAVGEQRISARDDHAEKPTLVSRVSSWIFGGGAVVLVAGAFVFLVVTKDESTTPAALFEPAAEKTAPAADPTTADLDDAILGTPAAAAPPKAEQQEAPADGAERYPGSPAGGDQRQGLSADRFDGDAKPTEAPARRSRNVFEPPTDDEPISRAKLDAIGAKKGKASAGDYVVDSPGALVGEAKPKAKPQAFAEEVATEPSPEPVQLRTQSADKKAYDLVRDEDATAGFAKASDEKRSDEGKFTKKSSKERRLAPAEEAAASSFDSEADDAAPRKDAPPPPVAAKPTTPSSTGASGRVSAPAGGAAAPAPSSGPPALSPEVGALLRGMREAELEKSQSKNENKTKLPVEQAKAAKREMDIEMTFATANSEFARGQLESALSTYVEAASLDVGGKVLGVLPHVGRMRTLNRLGRYSEALALVPKLKTTPSRPADLAEGYLQAGDAAYALGRYGEAETHYTLAKKSPIARARAETGLAAVQDKKRAPAADAAAPAESK